MPGLAGEVDVNIITSQEIEHTIKSFQQKAPGWNGITKIHLANAIEIIKEPLANCFNAAMTCRYFPSLYKQTKMIFVPKPGKDHKNVANYRPISLLNVTGKLFEKIINKRLVKHLQEKQQYNKHQHGFKTKRGTETALAMTWEAIAQGVGHHLKVCLTSGDVEKSFDRAW